MKKLIYLIVAIVALGLILSGCIPVVPPTEQNESGSLMKTNSTIYVDDNTCPTVGDGTVGNPFCSIQDAINAAGSGDTISVAAGNYYEGNISINKSLTIQGVGKSDTIVDADGYNYGFYIDTNNVTIKDLTVKNATHRNIVFYVVSVDNATIDNVESLDAGSAAIEVHQSTVNNLIINNSLFSCGYGFPNHGMRVDSGGVVNGLFITDSHFDGNDAGMTVYGNVTNAIITGSTFNNNVAKSGNSWTGGYGIWAGYPNIISNWTITGCEFKDNHYDNAIYSSIPTHSHGINLWAENPHSNITILDSEFSGNQEYGISVTWGGATNLEVHNCNIDGNSEYGIFNSASIEIYATRNWWGSPTGPCRELPNGKWVGKGDRVGSNIDYKPWSPQPVEFCNDLSLNCTTIQDGILLRSDGVVITTGYDEWGYDYQAHMFNGYYCDSYRDADWCQEWKDVRLMMCWNDAWLSNMDCDGDGLLDRHYGYESYIGSGAWLTNHQSGEYEGENGEICKWNYFVKIVAVPLDATLSDGIWYAADGTEIGPVIWGAFAIVQQVENDPCADIHGIQYLSPAGPGFGQYGPE